MSVREAAEALGCSAATLYRAVASGEAPVPVVRIGSRVSVPTAPLRALLGLDPPADGEG